MNHNVRVVPLDARRHGDLRQWTGDPHGHWEGDTLVVESVNFLRETSFMRGGASADLHLTERFTRVSPDVLLYEVTVDDPTTWTRPWTYEVPMRRNAEPCTSTPATRGITRWRSSSPVRGRRRRKRRPPGARHLPKQAVIHQRPAGIGGDRGPELPVVFTRPPVDFKHRWLKRTLAEPSGFPCFLPSLSPRTFWTFAREFSPLKAASCG